MLQPLRRRQFGAGLRQFVGQIFGHHRHLSLGVGNVMLQFLGTVHGVNRYHHGVGTQNSKMRHHQLRAVLHQQQHTVSALDTQLLQIARHALHLLKQFGVAGFLLQKDQRCLVGVSARAGDQVVDQRRVRRTKAPRNIRGPVGVFERRHGSNGKQMQREPIVRQTVVGRLAPSGQCMPSAGAWRGVGTTNRNRTCI